MNNSVKSLKTNEDLARKVNTSGYHPKGRAVLVKPVELITYVKNEAPTLASKGFVVPGVQGERSKMLEEKGLLVEVGAAAWLDEPEPRAYVGDIVLISKWCGTLITGKDGQTYRMCNADDVYCVADPDPKEAA